MEKEYLDVIDENDIVIGKETRKKVHEVGLWHRGVHVFLFNDAGEMLIQKRSADRSSNPSKLDCTVSEHVQAGESYQQAARRGLREEMGLENIEITKIVKFKMIYGINDNEISEIYEGKLGENSANFDEVEIESIHFMSLDEIKEKIQVESEIFCYWFIQMMNWYFEKETELVVMD